MPTAPPTPCTFLGCPNLVPRGQGGRCAQHQQRQRADGKRPFAGAVRTQDTLGKNLYGGARWKKASAVHLRQYPECAACGQPATTVDHDPPFTDVESFWDTTRWRSLCAPCHNRKSAREAAARRWQPKA